jgi:hypothetical protein
MGQEIAHSLRPLVYLARIRSSRNPFRASLPASLNKGQLYFRVA